MGAAEDVTISAYEGAVLKAICLSRYPDEERLLSLDDLTGRGKQTAAVRDALLVSHFTMDDFNEVIDNLVAQGLVFREGELFGQTALGEQVWRERFYLSKVGPDSSRKRHMNAIGRLVEHSAKKKTTKPEHNKRRYFARYIVNERRSGEHDDVMLVAASVANEIAGRDPASIDGCTLRFEDCLARVHLTPAQAIVIDVCPLMDSLLSN